MGEKERRIYSRDIEKIENDSLDRSPTIGYASDNKNGESNSSLVICTEKKEYRS